MVEVELIKEVKSGSKEAFKQLYEDYFNYAMRVATAVTKSQTTAADVVQEAFIRVYNNIHYFDDSKSFKPWFYRILINECNRYLKKHAKVIPIDVNENMFLLEQATDERAFEEYADLYQALQKLDDHQRVPLILKYLDDLTEMDIALALELNINTVKSRLYKGKRKLRDYLQEIKEANG